MLNIRILQQSKSPIVLLSQRMRNLLYSLIFTLIGTVSTGCTKKIDAEVAFQLTYDGEPLIMLQEYEYPDGKKVIFSRFSFYLSDFQLAGGDKSVALQNVDFVNLTSNHENQSVAERGLVYFSDKIELPALDEISFNLGLSQDQNTAVPADFATDHPQGKPGEYWLAWDSYIFVKIEGRIDLDGDDDPEAGIALHLGSNNVMREIRIPVNGMGNKITLEFDLKNVFENGSIYDIAENPQLHSLSQLPAAEELADNISQAIKIKSR